MTWSPDNMGEELLQWLKADAITGLSDTDPVTTWIDSSPNSRDVAGSGTARPLYLSNQINALPAVNFDGSNDVLSSSQYTLAGQRVAMVVVCKFDSLKNYNPVMQVHSTSTPTYTGRVLWVNGYSDGAGYAGSNNYMSFAVGTLSTSALLLTVGHSDLTGAFVRKNGVALQAGSGSYIWTPPVSNYSGPAFTHLGDGGAGLGAGRFYDGSIAECVLCDCSYCDYLWVEWYLANKYSIALNGQHPFYASAPTAGPRQSGGGPRLVNVRGGADQ